MQTNNNRILRWVSYRYRALWSVVIVINFFFTPCIVVSPPPTYLFRSFFWFTVVRLWPRKEIYRIVHRIAFSVLQSYFNITEKKRKKVDRKKQRTSSKKTTKNLHNFCRKTNRGIRRVRERESERHIGNLHRYWLGNLNINRNLVRTYTYNRTHTHRAVRVHQQIQLLQFRRF